MPGLPRLRANGGSRRKAGVEKLNGGRKDTHCLEAWVHGSTLTWGGEHLKRGLVNKLSVSRGEGRTARCEALERSGLDTGILESLTMTSRSSGKTTEDDKR